MKVGGHDLAASVLVVAEVGNNHEGHFEVAQEMVRKAAESGAGAVKFQTFRTKYFVSPKDKARFERLSKFELTQEQFRRLHDLARSLGLLFLSTPLDLGSAEFLAPLVDAFKIASSDNTFYPLLESVAGTGKPVVLSSGLADVPLLKRSQAVLERRWAKDGTKGELAVLHCVTSYPVPEEQVNLAAIPVLARELGCTVGYSDHTLGIEASVLAVTLGARVIEKHFTLDKNFSDFRDHQLSADPPEMRRLVGRVRQAETLLGQPRKAVQPSEAALEAAVRRSIVAAADLEAGYRLTAADLTWLRPGGGLPPGEEGRVIGKRLRRAMAFGEPIVLGDVE